MSVAVRRRSLAALTAATVALVGGATAAEAHGPSGSHESPAWCGGRLAMLADGGVLVDDTLVALPVAQALVAWSPGCEQVAVVGDKAWLVDATTTAVRDLGRLPGGYQRAMRLDGPAPSVRWSPSGRRFAVVAVNATIQDETVARFDVASGSGVTLAVTGEIRAFALLDDDAAVVAVRPVGANDVALVRATAATSTPMTKTAFTDARISVAPVVAGLLTAAHELVVIDVGAGRERVLAPGVDYLQAMSADGTHALAVVGHRAATIDGAGRVFGFAGDLSDGLVADEQTGWSGDGAVTVAPAGRVWMVSASGARARRWKGLPRGEVEHVAIAPDGKRAAFLVEVAEPGVPRGHCDVESWTRADLYIGSLGGRARPRKVATVAHLHGCGVE